MSSRSIFKLPRAAAFAAQRVLHTRHVPIIIVSTLGVDGIESMPFLALAAGAADVIVKPAGDENSLRTFFPDLNERIATLALANSVPTHTPVERPVRSGAQAHTLDAAIECVVVGASTGGPPALVELLTVSAIFRRSSSCNTSGAVRRRPRVRWLERERHCTSRWRRTAWCRRAAAHVPRAVGRRSRLRRRREACA